MAAKKKSKKRKVVRHKKVAKKAKMSLAARAKKHGVSVAKFKSYLHARAQLGREMLG